MFHIVNVLVINRNQWLIWLFLTLVKFTSKNPKGLQICTYTFLWLQWHLVFIKVLNLKPNKTCKTNLAWKDEVLANRTKGAAPTYVTTCTDDIYLKLRTLFHDTLQHSMERNISMHSITFCKKNVSMRFYCFRCC